MKNKIKLIILSVVMTLTLGGGLFIPAQAHAGFLTDIGCVVNPAVCISTKVGSIIGSNVLLSLFAEIGNISLRSSSFILSLAGILLNTAMVLTMNIKAIVDSTPAIEQTWILIRNISSMFIIFALVYASIIKILDVDGPNLGKMIKNIVIAGLLINFSFLFTKVLIDGSNLVSLQLYRAIAPQSQNTILSSNFDSKKLFDSSYYDGGISNVFMQSLKIPSVYNQKKGLLTGVPEADFFHILISTIGGSVLMIFAALSFFAVAVACVIRLIILLLLLGFSPVYFVGIIFPDIDKDLSSKWSRYLREQLIFLPAYLLFMYVAMRFISSDNGTGFFAALDSGRLGSQGNGVVSLSLVGLILQYTIAFILINVPLIAAVQFGGLSAKWGQAASKWAGGFIGKNTMGRLGSTLDKKLEGTIGNGVIGRQFRDLTTLKAAKSNWGGWSSRKDDEKLKKEIEKKGRDIKNLSELKQAIQSSNHAEIKRILKSMSTNEIASLGKSELTHPNVVPHLTSAVYNTIEKGEKSEADKATISGARSKLLERTMTDAITAGATGGNITIHKNKIKDLMKNMSGEQIDDFLSEGSAPGAVIDPARLSLLVENLRSNHLKDMESLPDNIRTAIGQMIRDWHRATGRNHAAFDYVTNKNPDPWA